MVQTWKTGPGKDFKCPHCGADYEVTVSHFPATEQGSATCQKCRRVMAAWNDISVPSFNLKKGPDDA